MTDAERVLIAVERFAAQQRSSGRVQCECCGDWHRGEHECDIPAIITIACVVGLAMLAH
jgi:hypothetical protein